MIIKPNSRLFPGQVKIKECLLESAAKYGFKRDRHGLIRFNGEVYQALEMQPSPFADWTQIFMYEFLSTNAGLSVRDLLMKHHFSINILFLDQSKTSGLPTLLAATDGMETTSCSQTLLLHELSTRVYPHMDKLYEYEYAITRMKEQIPGKTDASFDMTRVGWDYIGIDIDEALRAH